MATTPRQVIDSVVRSVCGHEVEQLVRLTSGGVNETYRVGSVTNYCANILF
jgi:hypothetical protein